MADIDDDSRQPNADGIVPDSLPPVYGWPMSNSSPGSPVLIREIVALTLLVILSDIALYRSVGFAGPGMLFLMAPILLGLGTVRVKGDKSLWILGPMLALLAVRLVWCGSALAVFTGFVLLCCFAMGLAGIQPYVTRTIVFASQLIAAGYRGLNQYFRTLSRYRPAILATHWFAVILPAAALVTFSTIFVLANPDLVKSFGQNLIRLAENLEEWMRHFQYTEVLFCLGAAWIATGLLRPEVHDVEPSEKFVDPLAASSKSPYYDAYRNTLIVVIGLFAAYLTFEFRMLWFKKFPVGFHYSGYAHEGAAWLTIALGLATIMLSLIFRGTILTDPRLSRLRILSWIWSIENLLLAIAVFNRLFIYIGFNGMTQMRVVGMLGVASVVVGFLLVLWKIARNHDFTWLVRRQLWTVSFAAYVYAVLPVDAFVNQFNVNRILADDPRPSVQISVHPTSDEGWLFLKPLIDCTNPIIRDGVRGLLDEKLSQLEFDELSRKNHDWTSKQIATDRLRVQLSAAKTVWKDDPWTAAKNDTGRQLVIQKFREYAFQWY